MFVFWLFYVYLQHNIKTYLKSSVEQNQDNSTPQTAFRQTDFIALSCWLTRLLYWGDDERPKTSSLGAVYVTEWRRFLLASFRSDLVKQIFNDQTSKVQLFTEFITDILYVHDVSSL